MRRLIGRSTLQRAFALLTAAGLAASLAGCGITARDLHYAHRSLSVRPAADISPTPVERFSRQPAF
ncbi:MAG: hypothetical protein ACTS22_00940 [Phycisphaerales bacterium]